MWHNGGHSLCRCGCRWVPVRGFVCLFWHEIHTKDLRVRFPMRPEEDERRQDPRAVNREDLVIVRERQLMKEELGLVDPEAGLTSARRWVSVPGSCVRISLRYSLVIATDAQKSQKSVQTSPFLGLRLTQVLACLFFFLPLLIIYVISFVYL